MKLRIDMDFLTWPQGGGTFEGRSLPREFWVRVEGIFVPKSLVLALVDEGRAEMVIDPRTREVHLIGEDTLRGWLPPEVFEKKSALGLDTVQRQAVLS